MENNGFYRPAALRPLTRNHNFYALALIEKFFSQPSIASLNSHSWRITPAKEGSGKAAKKIPATTCVPTRVLTI
jgi:hypothetical protein